MVVVGSWLLLRSRLHSLTPLMPGAAARHVPRLGMWLCLTAAGLILTGGHWFRYQQSDWHWAVPGHGALLSTVQSIEVHVFMCQLVGHTQRATGLYYRRGAGHHKNFKFLEWVATAAGGNASLAVQSAPAAAALAAAAAVVAAAAAALAGQGNTAATAAAATICAAAGAAAAQGEEFGSVTAQVVQTSGASGSVVPLPMVLPSPLGAAPSSSSAASTQLSVAVPPPAAPSSSSAASTQLSVAVPPPAAAPLSTSSAAPTPSAGIRIWSGGAGPSASAQAGRGRGRSRGKIKKPGWDSPAP